MSIELELNNDEVRSVVKEKTIREFATNIKRRKLPDEVKTAVLDDLNLKLTIAIYYSYAPVFAYLEQLENLDQCWPHWSKMKSIGHGADKLEHFLDLKTRAEALQNEDSFSKLVEFIKNNGIPYIILDGNAYLVHDGPDRIWAGYDASSKHIKLDRHECESLLKLKCFSFEEYARHCLDEMINCINAVISSHQRDQEIHLRQKKNQEIRDCVNNISFSVGHLSYNEEDLVKDLVRSVFDLSDQSPEFKEKFVNVFAKLSDTRMEKHKMRQELLVEMFGPMMMSPYPLFR